VKGFNVSSRRRDGIARVFIQGLACVVEFPSGNRQGRETDAIELLGKGEQRFIAVGSHLRDDRANLPL